MALDAEERLIHFKRLPRASLAFRHHAGTEVAALRPGAIPGRGGLLGGGVAPSNSKIWCCDGHRRRDDLPGDLRQWRYFIICWNVARDDGWWYAEGC